MSPTLQKLVRELAALGRDAETWAYDGGPPPCLTCPSKHPEVGPLHVYDDGDELTVCLHEKHHSHIAAASYLQNPESVRLHLVALEAARLVNDILLDRVLFTVNFLGTRCLGSSHVLVGDDLQGSESRRAVIGLCGGNIRSKRYLWSGPFEQCDEA